MTADLILSTETVRDSLEGQGEGCDQHLEEALHNSIKDGALAPKCQRLHAKCKTPDAKSPKPDAPKEAFTDTGAKVYQSRRILARRMQDTSEGKQTRKPSLMPEQICHSH